MSEPSTSASRSRLFAALTFLLVVLIAELLARGVQLYLAAREMPGIDIPVKQPGTFRVMLYGGSTVEGAPLTNFSFASQLEYQLRQRAAGKPLEVINLGRQSRPSAYARALLERTIDTEPDLIIVLTGNNEFLLKRFDQPPNLRESTLLKLGVRLVSSLAERMRESGSNRYQPDEFNAWDRDSPEFARKLADYDANLMAIAGLATEAQVPLILGTLPANLADWPPAWRDIRGSYFGPEYAEQVNALYVGLDQAQSDSDRQALQARLAKLSPSYPDDASLAFISGKLLEARGDKIGAAAWYRLAKERDPIPWRVLSHFNATVREIAEQPGIYLADIAAAFDAYSDEGLVGYDLIADNCHPSPLGSALMARELLNVMATQQFFVSQSRIETDPVQNLQEFLTATVPADEMATLQQRYYFTLAKYSMKGPFYNFAASRKYSALQLQIDPKDWRGWANLGTVSLLNDDPDNGARQLKLARQLKGGELNRGDRAATPYLHEAIEKLESLNVSVRWQDS